MSKLYSVEEAANYLGISGAAVRQAIKDGRLASKKVGKVHILLESALRKYRVNTKMRAMGEARAKKRKKKT